MNPVSSKQMLISEQILMVMETKLMLLTAALQPIVDVKGKCLSPYTVSPHQQD